AFSASLRSLAEILGDFWLQHWSTAFKHHSALLRDARMGFPPTVTKIGFVCDVGKILTAIQLLRSMRVSKATSLTEPSAMIFLRATGSPLTMSSTGTSRVFPIRARSISQ